VLSIFAADLKVGESNPMPDSGFADYSELQNWAHSSSFGGGGSGKLQLDAKRIYYSIRSFTSGRASSETIFYTKIADGRIKSFLVVPIQWVSHRVRHSKNKESAILEYYDTKTKKWLVVFELAGWMLPDSAIGTEQGIEGQRD